MNQGHGMRVRLQASNLIVSYDNFVAIDIPKLSLTGSIIAIIGHNGAGKSTLIKNILGLLPSERGKFQVIDEASSNGDILTAEEHMAFCPETGSVFGDISVESYVKLWCRMRHRDGAYYKKEGRRYIELLNLEPLLPKLGRELSKGQRRRVQTAIGFLLSPKLFLFDEPFDGLDVQRTNELTEIMAEESCRTAFVVSSHRMDVMERLADTALVLRDGKMAAAGPISDVCELLAGRSIQLEGSREPADLCDLLRMKAPNYVINNIGGIVEVTGQASMEDVSALIPASFGDNIKVSARIPSLVDAMNYHLKSLEPQRTGI